MGDTGALGHLGVGRETTYGTPVAPTFFTPIASESLTLEKAAVEVDQVRAVLDAPERYEGLNTVSGGFEVGAVYPGFVGTMLRAFAGAGTVSGTNPFTHTFTPTQTRFAEAVPVPPYTVEVKRDQMAHRYTSFTVSSLGFSQNAGELLSMSVSGIAQAEAVQGTPATPTFEAQTVRPWHWNDLVVQRGGAGFGVIRNLSINMEQSLEGVARLDATRLVGRVVWNGWRTITGSMTLDFAAAADPAVTDFTNWATAAWSFAWTRDARSLTITVPRLRPTAVTQNLGGPGMIELSVDWVAEYDSSLSPARAAQVILVNNTATYNA